MEINLMEKIAENARINRDLILLVDEINPKGITYGEFDRTSGKVYRYLKEQGIGREDFVMICLPRSMQPIVAMCGVWKNGSAFVVVEDTYAPERIEFIRKDCNCKLVINEDIWQEIQHVDYLEGYEKTDPHDAAFAIYTSGTTGNPKGVLHEYGNLSQMIDSILMRTCEPLAIPEDRFALVAPLNFIASQLIILYAMYFTATLFVVPYDTVKNPVQIGLYIIKNRITGTFLTPSYIRKLGKKPPVLKFCIIGSEPANGVFLDGLKIHNFYLMSESGFAVTHFLIDKKYEYTPVGNSECGYDVLLLDESGNPVPQGEEGEICFKNEFVRGYLNLPEETSRAFRDGLYHTGDLARSDEKGRLIICGRMSDMVKINGNRVEPGEIENVALKVLNVKWAAVRIIQKGDHSMICVYYTDNSLTLDYDEIREKFQEYLPYYMVPSHFIHIDEIPMRPNGKLDRKALPAPSIEDFKKDYVAPRNDVEKAICQAFEEVLQVQNVGIHDDFYQLGGDSMSCMDILVKINLSGLTATDIYRGHTPEKITELYNEKLQENDGVSPAEKNEEVMKAPQPLTQEQLYMVDYQLYTPKSTMFNLYNMLKLDKEILDLEQLAHAMDRTLKAHPALLTTYYFDQDGRMMQKYSPEVFTPIQVEKVTEEEMETIKKELVQPFNITKERLYRCRLFETEQAGYLFLDVHHTIFDGTSTKILFSDMMKAYAGEDLPMDMYYYILYKREQQRNSPFYLESKKYFTSHYDNVKWHSRPKTDHVTRENENDDIILPIPVNSKSLKFMEKKYSLTPNMFYIAVSLLSMAIFNSKRKALVNWVHNGRDDLDELSAVGLLFHNLPVGVQLYDDMTIKKFFKSILNQVNKGVEHSIYPYVALSNVVTDDSLCLLYQDDLRNSEDLPGLLGQIELPHNYAASQSVIDLEVLNSEEGTVLMLDYSASRYEESTIKNYDEVFNATAVTLLRYAKEEDTTIKEITRKVCKATGRGGFLSKAWRAAWLKR